MARLRGVERRGLHSAVGLDLLDAQLRILQLLRGGASVMPRSGAIASSADPPRSKR
jgi:hypothetical protein